MNLNLNICKCYTKYNIPAFKICRHKYNMHVDALQYHLVFLLYKNASYKCIYLILFVFYSDNGRPWKYPPHHVGDPQVPQPLQDPREM